MNGSAEWAIVDRIYSRWPIPYGLTHRLPLESSRYYLAHAAGARWAVLRLKTAKGIADWRQRQWRLFGVAPTITDVTFQALQLIETILEMGPPELLFANVWALTDSQVRLVATKRVTLPPAGATPLWELRHDDRHDLPINQFRNRCWENQQYFNSHLLRMATAAGQREASSQHDRTGLL